MLTHIANAKHLIAVSAAAVVIYDHGEYSSDIREILPLIQRQTSVLCSQREVRLISPQPA